MSGDALDSRCRMLERLAGEVSRLNYHAAKGKVQLLTAIADKLVFPSGLSLRFQDCKIPSH